MQHNPTSLVDLNPDGDRNWLTVTSHVNAPGLDWQYPRLVKLKEV